jgi:predicted transcriptional regulator
MLNTFNDKTFLMKYKPNETLLLKYLGASPILRIVDFFLDNPLSDYSKNEILNNLEMGRVTFFIYWKELENSGAIKATRKVGRATMYELDRNNEVVKQLIKLDMALAKSAMEKEVGKHRRKVVAKST